MLTIIEVSESGVEHRVGHTHEDNISSVCGPDESVFDVPVICSDDEPDFLDGRDPEQLEASEVAWGERRICHLPH